MTLIFFVTHTAIVREYQEFFLMKIAPLLDPVEEFEIQNHLIFGHESEANSQSKLPFYVLKTTPESESIHAPNRFKSESNQL